MNTATTTTKIWESRAKTTQPKPALPAGTHMIVPIGISTYPYFTEWQLPAVMSAKTTTTKNRVKSHKEHSAKYTPPTRTPLSGRHIIVPIVITTYKSPQERRFPMTTSATTMTNKRWKLHKGHSTHARSSLWEVDDSTQRDYDRLIHSPKVIPDDYDRNNDDDK